MLKKNLFVLMVAVLFCFSMTPVSQAGGPIKIGSLGALSGPGTAMGTNMMYGLQMAIEEINEAGGVLGRKLELIYLDDATEPAQSVSAMTKLAHQDKVDIVVGGFGSATVLANMKVCEKAGMPYLVLGASNPKITSKENKWTFRFLQTDAKQGLEIAEVAVKTFGYKRFGIIHDRNEFGTGARDVFCKGLAKYNLKPLIIESYQFGDKDFTSQLLKIREAQPDAIGLFGTLVEGAAIAKKRTQLGMGNLRIFSVAGLGNIIYIKLGGNDAEGTVCLTPFNPHVSPEAEQWAQRFEQKYKASKVLPAPTHGYVSYASIVNVVKPAYELAGSTDKAKVRDALRKINWRDFGQYSDNYFDETGQAVRNSIIVEVKNLDFVPIK